MGIYCTESWAGSRASLIAVEKRGVFTLGRKESTVHRSGGNENGMKVDSLYRTVNRLRAAQPMGHSLIPGKDKNISILHNVQLALSPQAKQHGYKADHSSSTLTSEV